MKKAGCIFLTLWIFLCGFSVSAAAEEPVITSKSAILIDAQSGQVLFEKNKEQKVYPASITKILTIYLAAKNCAPEEIVTASETAIDCVPKDSSNIALDYGEQLTVEQASNAAMLMSANDACNVLAEHVSGSIDAFVKQMNTTAQLFGATGTNFVNTNGLPDENHYTTAQDFAKITRAILLEGTAFNRYFGQKTYTIPSTNKKAEARNFVSKHRMIHMDKYQDLGVVGGKTGYTTQAGHTAVTYAKKEGREVIVVVFGAPNMGKLYEETKALIEYAVSGFTPVLVTAEEIGEKVDGKLHTVPTGTTSFYLSNGQTKQDLTYTFSENQVLITDKEGNLLSTLLTETREVIPKSEKMWSIVWKVLLGILAVFVLWYISLIIKTKRKRQKRLAQRKREEIMERTDVRK